MIEKKYGRRAAEHILGPLLAEDEVFGVLDDALRVDDAGVWAGDEGPWLWLPAMELDTREIDLSDTPGLPFPFDAIDLAAFMVDGVGNWIRAFYGAVEDGPDADRLALMHQHANVARESLAAAYMVLRDAVNVVGAEPDSNTPEWIEWRRAMVRKLYEMRQDSPSASAPALAGPCEAVPVLGAGRRRAPTVHELIAPFIARVLADHPEWTAKQIHSEMCRAARERTYGLQMSRAGELVCSAAGRAFGLPAIEKAKTAHRKNRGSTVEPPSNR